jgi:GPH family glycoside/pentoside/hexuronide:cation symporter
MRPMAKIISFTTGSIPANLVSLAYGSYVQSYYIDVLHGQPDWIGVAATIQAVYATLVYPFLGYLSDRTYSRWGQRVPFIMYGSVPLGVAFMLVWTPPVSAHQVLLFSLYFLLTAIFYDTMFNLTMVNWSALFPEMFRTPAERSMASAWKQMFGIIGLVGGLALPTLIAAKMGWPAMGVLFGIISILALLTTIPSMELKRRRAEQRAGRAHGQSVGLPVRQALKHTLVNKSFVTFIGMRFFVQFAFTMLTADLYYYAKYNLGLVDGQQSYLLLATLAVALPLVYVWGWLVPRIGASRAVVLAILLFGLALCSFNFTNTFSAALMAAFFLGVGLSGILVLTDILISDIIDEDQVRTGVRREGMFYGIHGLLVGLCTPAQAVVTTAVLVSTGYTNALGAHQPTSALFGFKMMITWIPLVALAVALLFFWRYPLHRKHVTRIQEQLRHISG